MKSRIALLVAASLAGLGACAFPISVRHFPIANDYDTSSSVSDGADARSEPPIVQIRQYPHSPTVAIVAWAPDDNGFGLSAWLRRDGSLVHDHQLYVSTYYNGGVALTNVALLRARWNVAETIVPANQVLLSTGISRDPYHCYWGAECSPYEVRGLRVRDEMLRANRDSIAVRIYGRGGTEMVITLHRELIDAYLSTVDSVSAELRKSSARF
jgi:hypothetical protein